MAPAAQIVVCTAVSLLLLALSIHNALLTARVFDLERTVADMASTLQDQQHDRSDQLMPGSKQVSFQQRRGETGSAGNISIPNLNSEHLHA